MVENARAQLLPHLEAVLGSFDPQAEPGPAAFFTLLMMSLQQVQDDADLMGLFFELSATAFQGFEFSPLQAERVDALLAVAESIAFTLAAPSDDPH